MTRLTLNGSELQPQQMILPDLFRDLPEITDEPTEHECSPRVVSPFAPPHEPLLFTRDEAQAADEERGFNCGPAALCAVMGMRPRQLWPMPLFLEFERKRYMNPTLMREFLQALCGGLCFPDTRFRWTCARGEQTDLDWPSFGLARIQWGGPWTRPGVPVMARYRKTHWVGCYRPLRQTGPLAGVSVFDVNALCAGGWIRLEEWARQLVPWLLGECEPKADGSWWITHAVEVYRVMPREQP